MGKKVNNIDTLKNKRLKALTNVTISVVVPVFNEQDNLPELLKRLFATLDKINKPYEIILVNDGSQDNSYDVMLEWQAKYPQQLVLVDLMRNFGQHMAVIAGFMQARGKVIVTLDADLQNPPEEIPKLTSLVIAGHDLVSGVRLYDRKDNFFRKRISIIINYIREKITDLKMSDHGCMLRAYSAALVKNMLASQEKSIFIPALAYSYARHPIEVTVQHDARAHGESRYSLYSLIRLNFDLMAGYSLVPIQIFSVLGVLISLLSLGFFLYLVLRRLWLGPEAEGIFTLFALQFLLTGITLLGIGIMGEYVGRIYKEVRGRHRFIIREVVNHSKLAADQNSGD